MNDLKRLVRLGFGHIADELRQRRAADKRVEDKVDAMAADVKLLIKLVGGYDAKLQALREDHEALRDGKVADHERRIRNIVNNLPALPAE